MEKFGLKPRRFRLALLLNSSTLTRYMLEGEQGLPKYQSNTEQNPPHLRGSKCRVFNSDLKVNILDLTSCIINF